MTKQEALRTAADRIECGQVNYRWDYSNSCNCGVLAQVVAGTNELGLGERRVSGFDYVTSDYEGFGTWAGHNGYRCEISDLPSDSISRLMRSIGFCWEEIKHLEHLSDVSILDRADAIFDKQLKTLSCGTIVLGNQGYSKKEYVVAYMRAWADMLDEQSEVTASACATDIEFRPSNLVLEEPALSK